MKKNNPKTTYPLIIVMLLSILSCITSLVTRYLYPPQLSTEWTDKVVGLGVAGVLFFGGMFWMLIALNTLKKLSDDKKYLSTVVFLIGMLVMLLGLVIAFAVYQN